WKHLYASSEPPAIGSQKDLEPIIKEYFDLKEQNSKNTVRLNELKTMIYGFMDEQKVERVFGDEGYITKSIQERHSYDLEKVREVLDPINKWNEILSADEKKLEEILPSFSDDIQQKILAYRSAKQISTLTASRKKINKVEK
ncbi:MAG: hypothetical protein GWP06_15825, partial [Actinobacteria bacterium]|nr:hypothetical protein [Actinomycetota bacterium]